MNISRSLIVTVVCAIFACSANAQSDESQVKEIKSLSYFTTGIFNGDPIDNVSEIKIDAERVYHFFEFSGLEERLYSQAVAIYDGAGNLVTEKYETVFRPKDGEYRTWFWYDLDPEKDRPGLWHFVVEFDGKPMTEQRLDVLPADKP